MNKKMRWLNLGTCLKRDVATHGYRANHPFDITGLKIKGFCEGLMKWEFSAPLAFCFSLGLVNQFMKAIGCSFSFSAKEKEPKRKLPAVPCPVSGLCRGRAIAAEQANAGFGEVTLGQCGQYAGDVLACLHASAHLILNDKISTFV